MALRMDETDPLVHYHGITTEDPLVLQTAGGQAMTGPAIRGASRPGMTTARPIHTDRACPKATSPSDPRSPQACQIFRHLSTFPREIARLIGEGAVATEEDVAEDEADDLGGSHRTLQNERC